MADSKITDLTELATADVSHDDLVEVVDTSASSNKKAKVASIISPSPASKTASFTFTAAEANRTTVVDSASAVVATIPTNAAVAYPLGTRLRVYRMNTGTVKVSPDTGVTLRLPTGIKPKRFMGVRANHAGATGVNITSDTALPFAAADSYDTDDFHDAVTNNTRITIPSGLGITKINLSANHVDSANTADSAAVIYFRKDGSTIIAIDNREHGYPAKELMLTAINIPATSGYFELMSKTESDASITISSSTYFALEVSEIDAQGWVAYQYGAVEIQKVGTDEWIVTDHSALG